MLSCTWCVTVEPRSTQAGLCAEGWTLPSTRSGWPRQKRLQDALTGEASRRWSQALFCVPDKRQNPLPLCPVSRSRSMIASSTVTTDPGPAPPPMSCTVASDPSTMPRVSRLGNRSRLVLEAVTSIVGRDGPAHIVIVAHEALNRTVLSHLVPALGDEDSISQRTGCWNRLDWSDGHWIAVVIDSVPAGEAR